MFDNDTRETYAYKDDNVVARSFADNSVQDPIPNKKSDADLNAKEKPEKQRMSRFERVTVSLTIIVALSALGSGIIFYFQYREMNGATAQTSSIIQKLGDQVGAINRLATATETANANTIAAERPWIGIATSLPDDLTKPGTIVFTFANTGRSPCRITSVQVHRQPFAQFPENPPYASVKNATFSRSLLTPGMSTSSQMKQDAIPAATMDELKKTGMSLYVYSYVNYIDVRTKQAHSTTACMYYSEAESRWLSCPQYNNAN
jgi:hypothetical protein